MIMELSDLLRYILYEGRKSQVPLVHELQMVVDYINLERIRYGNSLQLRLDLPEKTKDLYIAPLLLLPFIENCFKHGASKQLHAPWINLAVAIDGDVMKMELSNGKAFGSPAKHEGGIGIQNVYNRLHLLYPNAHQLEIDETENEFRVKLQMKLQKGADLHRHPNQLTTKESMAYAG
jgi:LytS/YehU family sensor histidine kinase